MKNVQISQTPMNKEAMELGIIKFLNGLGLDLNNQHFKKTPQRIVKAYFEIFAGLENTEEKIKKILDTAFESPSDQMVIVRNIHTFSTCPHHFLPVEYYVSVAYIPNGKVLGLSKIPRLVETLAKRPVIQEDFTEDIAEALMSIGSLGAAVQVEGQHLCMRMRGINKPESVAVTSSVQGNFRENSSTRNEFFSQIKNTNF